MKPSIAAILLLFFTVSIRAEPVNAPAAQPELQFDTTAYDFGVVRQEDPVKHTFAFKNAGKGDLVLQSIKTTCGCTAATASTGPFRSGDSGALEASYDTRGKFGHTQKEIRVFSNDPRSPHVLMISGTVTESMHPTKAPGEVIFKGSCAECHVAPAKGKSGKELYDAACFMCHDSPQQHGRNAIAPDLAALSKLSDADLKRIISHGMAGTSMPGFLTKKGGPLSKQQVQSLVEYIRSLHR